MNLLKRIVFYLMIPTTLIGTIAGVIAFLAGYISPGKFPLLALASLAMPGILLLNVLLTVYWAIRRKYYAFIPASIFLLNSGYVLSIFQINLLSPSVPQEAMTLKIATYNIRTFKSWSGGFPTQFDIINYLQEKNIDIVCFQEYYNHPTLNADSLGQLMELPYHTVGLLKHSKDLGTAIFSKYPVIGWGSLPFESKSNNAIWADIRIGDTIVRVINCHLETTNFNQKRKDINKYAHADAGTQLTVYENISQTLRNNSITRALQADIVRQYVDTLTCPVILCGDFNDPPSSYTYHRIKGKLKDSFRQQGNGYAYTYRGIHHLLRIDYIFHSSFFKCIRYQSEDQEWSDHNPVISEFIFATD